MFSRWLISLASGRAESVLSTAGAPRRSIAATASTTGTSVTKRNIRKPSWVRSVIAIPIANTTANTNEIAAALPHGSRCCRTMYWIISAGTTVAAATIECRTIKNMPGLSPSVTRRRTYSASSTVPAGKRWNNVAGQLRVRERKEHDGNDQPDHQKHIQSVFRAKHFLRSVHHTRMVSARRRHHKHSPRNQSQSAQPARNTRTAQGGDRGSCQSVRGCVQE